MYEVGLSRTFEAWHVMPGMAGPEGELHSHDYRLDLVVRTEDLDDRGMVCDIDVLEAVLDEVVGAVAGKNLEVIKPADADAVTVEIFATWAHGAIAERIPPRGELSVRIWESPVAFGGYTGPVRRA